MTTAVHTKMKPIALALTTDATVATENLSRQYLAIQNNTGGIVYIMINGAASTAAFQIAAGGTWEPNRPPVGEIHAFAATAGNIIVLEA